MTLVDPLTFTLGDGETIRRLAADPWTLAVGALLVFSAGLARHYDTHDLRRQSWRLLIPFAASTLAASLLFLVIVVKTGWTADVAPLGTGLLGLFWLTAPFAWLYGLPFEHLWRAPTAARARHVTLGVVAVLRVAIMARCVAALLGYSWWESLVIVACFALWMGALAIIAAFFFLGKPEERRVRQSAVTKSARFVVDAMSGVAITHDGEILEPDRLAIPPALMRRPSHPGPADKFIGCLTTAGLVGLLASPVILAKLIPKPPDWPAALPQTQAIPPSLSVWVAVALAEPFWMICLVWRQPAQRRRTEFVDRLYHGPLAEALRDLAALWPNDFPPNWNPAAALARRDLQPRMLEAACIVADLPAGSWVRSCVLKEFRQMIPDWLTSYEEVFDKGRMQEEQLHDLVRVRDLLRRLPESRDMVQPYKDYLVELCAFTKEPDPTRSALLEDLLALALLRGDQHSS
jgi:hypothetical protein